MRRATRLAAALVALTALASAAAYPVMPGAMASHWGPSGAPDDAAPKAMVLAAAPVGSALLLALFLAIPRVDPRRENIAAFRRHYDGFMLLMLGFVLYVDLFVIAWNAGYEVAVARALALPLAAVFYYAGVLLERAERNWFIGLRTPWTLSSEAVWRKTHVVGGKLFKAAGAAMLLAVAFPALLFPLVIGFAVGVALFSLVYSFAEHRRVEG